MAITTTITTDAPVTVTGAYLRITDLTPYKLNGNWVMSFNVTAYASQAAAEAGNPAIQPPTRFAGVAADMGAPGTPVTGLIVQAYDYLKAGPYAGATDII